MGRRTRMGRARVSQIVATAAALIGTSVALSAGGAPASASTSTPGYQDAVAYQMNSGHTGVSNDPVGPDWTLQWSKTLTGTVDVPLIAGGRIFALANTSPPSVTAYDAATGSVDWTVSVGASAVGITYAAGRVFEQSGGFGAIMSAYDAATGNLDWSATIPGQYSFSSAPTAANGIVYTGGAGSGGTLYAFDQNTGALLWTRSVANGDNSSPAADANGVYVSYACDLSYGFNATTGNYLWSTYYGCEGGGGQTAVLADGDLFLRDKVLSTGDGSTVRTFAAGPTPAVDTQYDYSEYQGTLRAETVANGTTLWSNAGDGGFDIAPIEVNGVVYQGSSSGHVFGISAITGQKVADINVGTAIGPTPYWGDASIGLAEGDGLLAVPAGDTLSVYGQSGTAPASPTGASAQAGSGQATVSWTVPADNGSPITDFTIVPWANGVEQTPMVVAAGSVGSATDPTQGASDRVTVPGLRNGTAYYFTVAADSTGGESSPSAPTGTVTPATLPLAPTSVSAVAGTQGAQVDWTVGSNGGSPISSFVVKAYQGATQVASQTVTAGGTGSPADPTPGARDSDQMTGLAAGSAVTFTVTEVNAVGPSAASAPSASVTPTANATVPYPPPAVTAAATANPGQIEVSWTVPGDNSSTITSFQITPMFNGSAQSPISVPAGAPGSALDPTPGSSDSYTLSNLSPGSYTFTVAAANSVGTGPASATTVAVTPGAGVPDAPSGVTAAAAQSGTASVSWIVPADNGAAISAFKITPYLSGSPMAPTTVSAGSSSALSASPGAHDSYNLGGLAPGSYTFTVTASNSAGTGSASAPSNSVSVTGPPPSAPAGVTAISRGRSTVTVSWTVPDNGGTPITSFGISEWSGGALQNQITVAAGPSGSSLSPTQGAVDSYTFDALSPGTYTFAVEATSAAGTGPWSQASPPVTVQNPPGLSASPASIEFGSVPVGDVTVESVTITNTGGSVDSISDIEVGGPAPYDYLTDTDCATLQPGDSCDLEIAFFPGTRGLRQATIIPVDTDGVQLAIPVEGTGTEGYYIATANGAVHAFGNAQFFGDLSKYHLQKPIVAIVSTGDDNGYWLVASDGGVFAFGDAEFFGSTGGIVLNKPIVGMTPTFDGGGYWLVASDGGIFAFGDAGFFGSTGGINLNKPIVGMASTLDGGGYWLVASDGGIFAFGDARFRGSTGGIALTKPIVGMAPTADGNGYYLAASDGGIFAFGDAHFRGSTGGIALNRPIVGMATTPDGGGYWLVASDGGLFSFGDAPFDGSTGGGLVQNAIGIADSANSTLQSFLGVPASRPA